MRILGIETSCDETSTSIIEGNVLNKPVTLLSNVVSSSVKIHAKTGGIIPENAAREQIKLIIPVIQHALKQAFYSPFDTFPIDAIAVTFGPGLIGSLLVGVETAKTLAYVWNKPIVPVNHLLGHIYANFIEQPLSLRAKRNQVLYRTWRSNPNDEIEFPAIALLISGGHTDLILMNNHNKIKWLGGTRDDAAGEALDKIGRLLGLPYPAGPEIERLAKNGNSKAYNFPRSMIGSNDYDFSFSGLKTAVLRTVSIIKQLNNETISDLCASVQQAIIDVLVKKTINSAQKYNVKSILLGGGVAANEKLRNEFILNAKRYLLSAGIFVPQKSLCTDNAAMIATAAFYNYKPVPWNKISASPEAYFA